MFYHLEERTRFEFESDYIWRIINKLGTVSRKYLNLTSMTCHFGVL